MPSLKIAFYIGAAVSAIAAVLSALRGEKFSMRVIMMKWRLVSQ